ELHTYTSQMAVAKILKASLGETARVARHHGAYIRGFAGDRIMIVTEQGVQAASNAVEIAISMRDVVQKVLNPTFQAHLNRRYLSVSGSTTVQCLRSRWECSERLSIAISCGLAYQQTLHRKLLTRQIPMRSYCPPQHMGALINHNILRNCGRRGNCRSRDNNCACTLWPDTFRLGRPS